VINSAISFGVAVVLAALLGLLGVKVWIAAPIGLVAGAVAFVFIARKVNERLEAIFRQASDQMKRQQWDPAIKTMQGGYALAPWQFMVRGAINGQIGMTQYVRNKPAEAEPLLRAAGLNNHIAKAMLAILHWKRGETRLAKDAFSLALKAGRKDSVIYAVYAYVLNEMRDRDRAIEVLNEGLKHCKDDERLLTNRTMLQNKKSMKMKPYGEQWYQFMLERHVVRQEPPPFARISRKFNR
jgi:predicted Zn-dependent protease